MRGEHLSRRGCLLGGAAASILLLGTPTPASAQSADVIQSQETNTGGIVAEITQCKRKDGILTIKLRLRNTSTAKVNVTLIDSRNFDSYYLTAGDKKYFVLRDTENVPLMPQADGFGNFKVQIAKEGSYTWWAKFPAPPADVAAIAFYSPITAPFDDVPITD